MWKESRLSINGANEEQSIFYNKIKTAKHSKIPDKKRKIFKNLGFLFNVREKVLSKITMLTMVTMFMEKQHLPHLPPSKISIKKSTQVQVLKYQHLNKCFKDYQ